MPHQETEMLWATLHRRNKIVEEHVLSCAAQDVLTSGLVSVCKVFDIACPVVMQKHGRELDQFGRTCFAPADFIDHFPYSTLCLERFEHEELGGPAPAGT